ncbi:flagellar protein FliS [uncultured Sphingomonas sp.]|jgi:flagellar protein FliS|uniref:flagellar export chaperone FliS n=1 Tax=uncultured Sphingomonas sp. TaxID=158754 RepID=UPI002622709C|nr:flagellar protein FliS [uncultured Sphingomonas sp.]
MFASAGYASAKRQYATIDLGSKVEGASPHRLIAILYDELLKTMDALTVGLAANGTLSQEGAIKRRGRASSILLGLEGSLDHAQGGDLARGLAAVYREARRLIDLSVAQHNPKPIIQAREMIVEISEAWARIG